MVSTKEVEREIFSAVGETCPAVDAALERAAESIKEQTIALRDSLRDYATRALNAEEALDEAQEKIKQLEDYVQYLERELGK